jgi:steroid delta-isomerase-like uncharacterized protein
MSKQNKTIARKVFEDIQSQGNLALIDEIVAGDYVGHTPLADLHGPEDAKQFEHMLHEAFPDYRVTVEDQIAEGDKVATRWTAQGTHKGKFQGMPATGKNIKTTGLTIFRIANGKLVEGWNNPDLLGMLQQLGAVPAPEQG